jgi:hypothetical protein
MKSVMKVYPGFDSAKYVAYNLLLQSYEHYRGLYLVFTSDFVQLSAFMFTYFYCLKLFSYYIIIQMNLLANMLVIAVEKRSAHRHSHDVFIL